MLPEAACTGPPGGVCQATVRVEAPAHPRDGRVLLEHMHGDGAAIEERHRHRHLHHAKHCLPACCASRCSHIIWGDILHVTCLGIIARMNAKHLYFRGQTQCDEWSLHGVKQGDTRRKKYARRLTPTMDITIAAVIAQEMTPALSPAPYDWLATATSRSHTACSHLCTLHIRSTGRGAFELCTALSRSLTCVEGRPHTKEEVPAQIEELQDM